MPNRIIKESICTSDTIESLELFEEVFFYRLIVNCDDFGRFDGRTSILKARLFPLKAVNLPDKKIENAVAKLEEVGLIHVYIVESRPYIQIVTWADHQTIRNKKSKFPSFDEANKTLENNCIQLHANVPVIQSNPIQSNPNPIQYNSEQVACVVEDKKTKDEKYPPINQQIQEFTSDEELIYILKQFVEMRVKGRKKPTNYAFKLFLDKLLNLSIETTMQKEIVNQTVMNGWQTVYPLKKDYVSRFDKKQKQSSVPSWYPDYQQQLNSKPQTKEPTHAEKQELEELAKEIFG